MSGANKNSGERGGFVLGLIVGLLLGLAVALGVALYITKVPIPFVDKVPQRTAEQDAQEAARNKNWDPNAPLAGKSAAKMASGVVGGAPAPMVTAPVTSTPAPAASAVAPAASTATKAKPTEKPADKSPEKAAAASAPAADPYIYFVQAGAYTRTEDAEAQRAKLAIQGFSAKVFEKEQSGRPVYRVRVGPMDARDEAEGAQRKIEAAGFEANLVRVQR